jgi:uncharacterized membrane protein YhaH (DUF805 family)
MSMDLNKLSAGEKIAGASAVLLFIFMFLDWFNIEVSAGNGLFSASVSGAGGSAWDRLEFIPVILVIAIVAALAVVAMRLTDAAFEPPISANAVVAVLGAISALLVLFRIIDTPGVGSYPGVSIDVSPAVGIFLGLLAAIGVAYGGYRGMSEEGVTFASTADRLAGSDAIATSSAPSPPSAPTPPPPPLGEGPPPPPPTGGPPE